MFLRQISTIVILLSFVFPCFADESKDAIFGLRWGMTPPEIKSLGITMEKRQDDLNFVSYSATSLPKNLSETEIYFLIFSDGKLVKISAWSKKITDDSTGNKGKTKFKAIKKILQNKYGRPTDNAEFIGRSQYQGDDEFYQCLAAEGCGLWWTFFKTPTILVSLHLIGQEAGIGVLNVAAEAIPGWQKAEDKHDSIKRKADEDAL